MARSLKDMRELPISYEIPIERTKKFWEKLEEGRIYTTRCKGCGKTFFPPQSDCPRCLESDMEWIELSGEAMLEGFTHIVVRPYSFQDEEPYTVGVGKFKEVEGLRAVAWLRGFKVDEIKVGMDMKLVARAREEGPPTYEFVPME